jgi:hypothetical protein
MNSQERAFYEFAECAAKLKGDEKKRRAEVPFESH